jgi:nitrite reductase/ring-hydroxylating ferredoxin subunit
MLRNAYITVGKDGEQNKSLRPAFDSHGNPVVIVGGNGHNCGESPHGNTESQYADLLWFAQKNFPVKEVVGSWSEHDYIPSDMLPYIGYLHYGTKSVFTMTGYKKWGFTQAVAGGELIARMIMKSKQEFKEDAEFVGYAKLFDARRWDIHKSFKQAIDFQKLVSMHFFLDKAQQTKLNPKNVLIDIEDLQNDTGGICKDKETGKVCAAYRDNGGHLYKHSAICTHLGCNIQWNQAERSFDCPCHGSRYTFEGKVIVKPLATL